MPKPSKLEEGFSPMTTEQLRELRAQLQAAKRAGIIFVWVDW